MFNNLDSGESLAGRIKASIRGWGGHYRRMIVTSMLRHHRKMASQRTQSFNRGYGIRVGIEELAKSGQLQSEIELLTRPPIFDAPFVSAPLVRLSEEYGLEVKAVHTVCAPCRTAQSRTVKLLSNKQKWEDMKKKIEETKNIKNECDTKPEYPDLRYVRKRLIAHRLFGVSSRKYKLERNKRVPKEVWQWIWGKRRKVGPGEKTMLVLPDQLCFRCRPPFWGEFMDENWSLDYVRVVEFVKGNGGS
jgi:hypothetical protein